ncbi:hypothetical protein [Kocuria palustris]|uniref:hypothetical protein n=1 Tax=Kocuria palustris TaxID=71999 RepID=UPI00077B721A|nr:hypothetical protein [Kocuria palustris]
MRSAAGSTAKVIVIVAILVGLLVLGLIGWFSGLIPDTWEAIMALTTEPLSINGLASALWPVAVVGIIMIALIAVLTDL